MSSQIKSDVEASVTTLGGTVPQGQHAFAVATAGAVNLAVNEPDDIGDYVADEQIHNAKKLQLDKQFDEVCASAVSAVKHMLAGNEVLYRHMAKLTIWFHSAQGTNYINELIESKAQKNYKAKVSHGYNFAPIIDVIWMGIDRQDLPVNKSNRISRALNRLYDVYGSQYDFRADAEDDLVRYMIKNGGVNGLITYKPSASTNEDLIPDFKADKSIIRKSSELAKSAITKAYQDSLNFFRAKANLPSVQFSPDVMVNEDDVSLVLVSKKGINNYAVIDTVIDKEPISQVLSKAYLGHYAALPAAVRVVVETLATQCCPAEHEGTYTHLLTEAGKSSNASKKGAIRRLIYKHDEQSFLLSCINSNSSLVTIAKPKLEVLEGIEDDVALTTLSRRTIETYMVCPKNFRLIEFNQEIGKGPIPKRGKDFTHVLGINVLTAKKDGTDAAAPVYFHREPTDRQAMSQVDVIDRDDLTPQWQRRLKIDWFREFNAAFTYNWVNSHARHVNRPHQSVLEILFRHSSITVNFFNLDNQSDLHTLVTVPSGPTANGYRRSFLSKDLAIAMLQVAELPIIGEVTVALYSAFLKLSYETEVGLYHLYIPSVTSTGEPTGQGFGQYTMKSIISIEDMLDATDDGNELGEQ